MVDSALIGDIAACSNAEVHLDIDIDIVIAAHAGIERVEVRDGLTTIAHVRSGDAHRRTGSRIRIQCEGAEYRGRGCRVDWDVALTLKGPTLMRTAAVNFSNADCEVRAADDTVRWGYVTTGGTHAIDLWLDSAEEGVIIF